VSSYVYMKVLESQPERYDRGIAILSLGAASRLRRRLVDGCVQSGMRVLEIGCGTGALTRLAAKRGAEVVAFDVSGPMLAVARRRVDEEALSDHVRLEERGVSEMDAYDDASFDLVMSCLVFSELSADERAYALRHAHRVLRSGGRFALIDEVTPVDPGRKILHALVRVPLLVTTFLLTQTTTRPVDGLSGLVAEAGLRIEVEGRTTLGGVISLVAVKEPAS
jgi:ubiquinone/menaquinone biosynthesis C-methylase UbiE